MSDDFRYKDHVVSINGKCQTWCATHERNFFDCRSLMSDKEDEEYAEVFMAFIESLVFEKEGGKKS